MELADVLRRMTEDGLNASQLTDLKIGTVTGTNPLEITVNPAMPPLKPGVLYLTAAAAERKIPLLAHSHTTPAGETGKSLENLAALENGLPLPVKDGYIILNRGLESGDKVLLLRVMRGQRYVVLSRVMEVT